MNHYDGMWSSMRHLLWWLVENLMRGPHSQSSAAKTARDSVARYLAAGEEARGEVSGEQLKARP
jgi:hypothetical protein